MNCVYECPHKDISSENQNMHLTGKVRISVEVSLKHSVMVRGQRTLCLQKPTQRQKYVRMCMTVVMHIHLFVCMCMPVCVHMEGGLVCLKC